MNRGEIWKVRLDPVVGSEQRKTRPAVIISRDDVGILPVKVVVPFTDWKSEFADRVWMVLVEPTPENGLEKISAADTLQVRTVSFIRFDQKVGRLGELEPEQVDQIADTLWTVTSS